MMAVNVREEKIGREEAQSLGDGGNQPHGIGQGRESAWPSCLLQIPCAADQTSKL